LKPRLVKSKPHLNNKGNAPAPPKPPTKADEPLTLSHAIARATGAAAQGLGTEEPTGAALQKIAVVSDKIGNAKIKMDNDITERFYKPFTAAEKGVIAAAMVSNLSPFPH